MPSTRTRILQFLKVNPGSAALDISQALGMTAANIRHHLHKLEQSGLVEFSKHIPSQGRSHPIHRYYLSSRSPLNNLDVLTDILLDIMAMRIVSSGSASQIWQLIADQLYSRMDLHLPKSHNLTARLSETALCLNHFNYQSRWEARLAAPVVIFNHCPYIAVLDHHPELCQVDKLMLEKLIGKQVNQTARFGRGPSHSSHCAFAITH